MDWASGFPDLPGEELGLVPKVSRLTDSPLASMSFGYGIGVTPMQMATVVSVVANGGVLIKPHVVRAIIRDGQREARAPVIVRRVITTEAALTMTAMLENVVKDGTGRPAAFDRYLVAGKTGTAQVAATGYSGKENNVSFVGFVPSRKPEFIIFVLLFSPRGGTSSGGVGCGAGLQADRRRGPPVHGRGRRRSIRRRRSSSRPTAMLRPQPDGPIPITPARLSTDGPAGDARPARPDAARRDARRTRGRRRT